jgi:hypothetical protein
MSKEIKLLGILNIVWGAMGLLGAMTIGLLLFVPTILGRMALQHYSGNPIACTAVTFFGFFGVFFSIFLAMVSLPSIIGGIGLLYEKNWGRIIIMIVSFFHLLAFPLGTALGIFGIWLLLGKENGNKTVAGAVVS